MMEEVTPEVKVETTPTPAVSAPPTGVATSTAPETVLPAELKGWNWGAFFLSWIWGIGHRVWISLLVFPFAIVPVFGGLGVLAVMIVLGLKGNELAWKNRHFESVDQFRKVQKAWAIWGLVAFILGLVFMLTIGAAVLLALQDSVN